MGNTISMQDMRHLNLFGKITQVTTRHSFPYNEMIVFAVPRQMISKAIGVDGRNVRQISEILGRKIKIIAKPNGIENAEKFIRDIVEPVNFLGLEITEEEIILTAGPQSKASLIGRNKRRLLELQKIVEDYFNKDLRIV